METDLTRKKIRMTTRFLFKGLELDKRTRAYIEKRLDRLVKLVDEVSKFEIEVDMDKKGMFRVEIMIRTPHELFRSEEMSESVEGSVDISVDEIERQITHKKDRLTTLRRRGARSIKKKIVLDSDARF